MIQQLRSMTDRAQTLVRISPEQALVTTYRLLAYSEHSSSGAVELVATRVIEFNDWEASFLTRLKETSRHEDMSPYHAYLGDMPSTRDRVARFQALGLLGSAPDFELRVW